MSLERGALDRVAAVGAAAGVGSLFLRFLVVRPNRLAQGTGLWVWQALPPLAVALLAATWVGVAVLAARRPLRALRAPVLGVAGFLVLVEMLVLISAAAPALMPSANEFGRLALGGGAWVMILAAYLLILNASQRLRAREDRRLGSYWTVVQAVGGGILVVLFLTGNFDSFSVVKEYLVRRQRFFVELGNHLALSGGAVGVGLLIGIPLGIWAFRRRSVERPVFVVVNTVQTVPSLALFGLMIAPLAALSRASPALQALGVRGIGWAPALIALILFALLPITRNTFTGLKAIDPAVPEAGTGMGMSRRQLLYRVQLPLALPILLTGVRISMVQAIGNTTVAALIGAGGFGVFVFQGLGEAASGLILLGVFPVIVLAVLADKLMQGVVRLLSPAQAPSPVQSAA